MLSFIIPAFNEEALIASTITSLHIAAKAADAPYEIIVVDDASTDQTATLAADHGARVERVERRQIAAVRNDGAKVARGDVFFFVDADTIVPPQTVQAALNALQAGAVGGGSRVSMERPTPFFGWLYFELFLIFWRPLRLAAGCFIFARRDAFEAVGGFDERYFASEEIWLSRGLKRQGRFVILREHVITSARKARLYSPAQLFLIAMRLLVRGPRSWQQRRGLELWYEGKRES